MLERSLIGIAKVTGLLSRGNDVRFFCALLALAGALVFFMAAAGTDEAFADSALQHARDAPAATQAGHSYTRAVTDSVGVASYFDNPGSRAFASRIIVRGISDGVGVASEFGSPGQQAPATSSSAPRGYGPSLQQPGQRTEERLGQRLLLGNKGETHLYGSGVAQSGTPTIEVTAAEAGEMDFQEAATLGDGSGSDPDGSNNSRLVRAAIAASQSSEAMQGMVIYTNAVFGVYSFAIIALVVGRSPRLRSRKVRLGAGKVVVFSASAFVTRERLVIIIFAATIAIIALSSTGAVVGEAFADTNKAAIAYRSTAGSTADPKYREWNPSTQSWDPEVIIDKTNTSPISHVWLKFSPISTKRVLVTYSGVSGTGDGGLDSYVCFSGCQDPANWTFTDNFAVLPTYAAPANQRPFDMAFEKTSGDLIIVYDYAEASSSATDDLFYRVMTDSQTSFGLESTIDDTNNSDTAAVYSFVNLAAKDTPGTDEMALIAIDSTNSDADVIRWNGSTWVTTAGQQTELTNSVSITTEEAIDIAYETNSGDIMVVAGEGTSVRHNTYNAGTGTWGVSSTSTGTWAVGTINWLYLVSNPTSTSNEMFLAGSGDLSDLDSAYWSGSAWTDHTEHDASIDTHSNRNFSFAWVTGTSSGLLVWGTALGQIDFKRFTASNTFTAGSFVDTGTHLVMELASNPTTTDTVAALGLYVDSNNAVGGIMWNGGSNNPIGTGVFGTTDDITLVSTNARRPFSIDFQKVHTVQRTAAGTLTISDSVSTNVNRSKPINETIAFVDSISKGVTRSISDSLAGADSVTITRNFARPISETLQVTDSIAKRSSSNLPNTLVVAEATGRKLIASRSIAEALSLSNSVNRNLLANRAEGEVIAISDSVSRSGLFFKSESETIGFSNSATRNLLVARTQAESISVSESIVIRPSQMLGETVNVVDSVSRKLVAARAISNSLTMADTASATLSAQRAASDIVATIDSIARSAVFARSISQSIVLTDSTSRTYYTFASLSEMLAANDSISGRLLTTRSVAETISISDSIERAASISISLSDAVAVVNSLTRHLLASKAISDAAVIVDTLARFQVLSVSRSDTLAVSDQITSTYLASRQQSETLTVVDNLATTASHTRSAVDILVLADAIMTTKRTMAGPADTIAITDSISLSYSAARQVSDPVSIADQVSAVFKPARDVSDTFVVTDDTTSRLAATRNRSETMAIADSVVALAHAMRSVSDAITVADSVGRSYSAERQPSDSIAVADQAAAHVTRKSVSDTLTVTDAVLARITGVSTSDSLAISDALSAKVTSRAAEDSLAVTDMVQARLTATSVQKSDALLITDAVSAHVTLRDIADSVSMSDAVDARITASSALLADMVSISDSVSATVTSRAVPETLGVTDAIVAKVTARALSDNLAAADTLTASVNRAVADSLSLTDSITKSVKRNMQETLSATDSVEGPASAKRSASDAVLVSEDISTLVTRSISDNLVVEDEARISSVAVNIADSVSVADQARIASMVVNIADTLTVADQSRTTALAINIADSIAVADAARITSLAINVADSLSMADSARATGLAITITDSLSVTDTASAISTPVFGETVELTDAISLHVTRSLADALSVTDTETAGLPIVRNISDALAIADAARTGMAITIADALGVNAQLTDVSIQWNRTFDESLNFNDCTPFSCNQTLHFGEGLGLGDSDFFTSPPGRIPAEAIAVTDEITINRPQTFISLDEPIGVAVAIKPLLPILVNEKPEKFGVPPAIEYPTTVTWSGTPEDMRNALQLEPLYINATVDRNDLPNQIITLRPHTVSVLPTVQLPGNNVIVSDWAANIPAEVPVQVVVNFNDTPALADHRDFMSMMKLNWTANDLTTNFGLVVTVMDAPPAAAPAPIDELKPIYLNVNWWGNFPGADDPSVQTYYKSPPKFTFVVNDQWADDQQAIRDSHGVPDLKLWLLNDAGTQWEQITDIVKPVQRVDGTYTYVATLPHFSNYAITANKVATGSPPRPTGSPRPPVVPVPVPPTAANLVADLAESISIGDSQKAVPIEVIEEFGQKKVTVSIADAVAILTKPVSYKTFQVGDVNVKITVQDVKQESIVLPKATATFLVEMVNSGNKDEKFTLNFWYYDETGKKPYESSQVAELGPYESKQLLVDIPFTSPGIFEVTAEARSFPDNELVNAAQLTVTIPWLTINLYLLVVVAVVILGASGAVLALIMSRMGALAAGAGLLALLLLKKPKPRVRVTEDIAGIEDYDLIVEVKPKDGTNVQMSSPASLDAEIVNRSRRKQTFVLSYWAMDESGIRMREKSDKITIGARKTIKTVVSLDLPEGTYIFAVEVKPARGDDVWSHTRLRIRVL
ncbi:MAG: hypothetical protein ABI347_02710 [Nitrososphaera sp.]|jgi:hypothetical protein